MRCGACDPKCLVPRRQRRSLLISSIPIWQCKRSTIPNASRPVHFLPSISNSYAATMCTIYKYLSSCLTSNQALTSSHAGVIQHMVFMHPRVGLCGTLQDHRAHFVLLTDCSADTWYRHASNSQSRTQGVHHSPSSGICGTARTTACADVLLEPQPSEITIQNSP